jgi:hypothetical protein
MCLCKPVFNAKIPKKNDPQICQTTGVHQPGKPLRAGEVAFVDVESAAGALPVSARKGGEIKVVHRGLV